MYCDFFGFSAKPFELLPNPDFLYLSKGHRKALSHLLFGIQDRAGFTLMTGEVGSGKTTLVRDVIKQFNASTPLALVFNTRVDATQLLAMINEDFGLDSVGKDKVALLGDLNEFLVAQCSSGLLPILIVDEAQNLSAEALEEVRLLSNLESDCFKLLQIILVGQPELREIIAQPCLRQLRQRISVACHLGPLSREESEEYVYHRLTMVGKRDAVQFDDGTFDLIHEFSSGVPRLINVICSFVLLSAFVDDSKVISADLVREAMHELALEPELNPQKEIAEVQLSAGPLVPSSFETHLARIEKEYTRLSSLQAERESVQERLTSQGRLLEYLINKQQNQFREISESLKEITGQVDRLWQMLMPGPEGSVISFDAHRNR